jgi:predicted CoA-binding protein
MAILDRDSEIRELLANSRTIAVVGLSDNPDRDSHRVALYLQRQGFTIIPVNPGLSRVLGVPAYPDLKRVTTPVDIVNIFRRPVFVPEIVEEAIRIGARAVWMQLGVSNESAIQHASDNGLQVVTDRCIMVEHHRLVQ